ncbi:uncharacterized protein LOC119833374 [Zerene cesonia]|uniref:uncharacterized protein LOC119833374 n=1 Tax=Zerene cesonia TaxID=33412 RepID=UPI0018E5459F|nr:uncharacterized protein LOC119833374 [Zerene cesonia]
MHRNARYGGTKQPRKILNVRCSKYEAAEAIHSNKKYWKNVFNAIDYANKGPVRKFLDIKFSIEEQEIRLLSEALPTELFRKVCNILNMKASTKDSDRKSKFEDTRKRRLTKTPFLSKRQTFDIDRDLESDTDVEVSTSEDDEENKKLRMYQEFLRKPIREQITWASHYLEPEKEDEKTLVKKADDLTNRIAQEFCDYMKELGGDQQSHLFTPGAIKELFQVEFDTHVARSLQVVPKELPSVNEGIAKVTDNLKKSHYAALDREISKDIKAEGRKDRVRCFGCTLPRREQWRTPRNDTKTQWRSARHVPRDLVTLKTVWEGITNLRSVKEYCRWMIEHPEYRRAPYLNSLGMFDHGVLDARLTFELQQDTIPVSHTDIPAPIEHIRKRLSELADLN